ncbi:MAG: hypothetical protein IJQ93_09595, partial [Bacteroidales bacterium]|nr:hypothetical protein [Bacteroidales bacterium]
DAAEDDEFAHTYFLSVSGEGVNINKKILADFYHEPQPSMMKKRWSITIELAPGEYEASLTARDSWNAESTPATCTIRLSYDRI